MRPVAYQNTLNADTLCADLIATDTHTHGLSRSAVVLILGMNYLIKATCKKTRHRRKFVSKLFARLLAKSANFITCIAESLPCLKQMA